MLYSLFAPKKSDLFTEDPLRRAENTDSREQYSAARIHSRAIQTTIKKRLFASKDAATQTLISSAFLPIGKKCLKAFIR